MRVRKKLFVRAVTANCENLPDLKAGDFFDLERGPEGPLFPASTPKKPRTRFRYF